MAQKAAKSNDPKQQECTITVANVWNETQQQRACCCPGHGLGSDQYTPSKTQHDKKRSLGNCRLQNKQKIAFIYLSFEFANLRSNGQAASLLLLASVLWNADESTRVFNNREASNPSYSASENAERLLVCPAIQAMRTVRVVTKPKATLTDKKSVGKCRSVSECKPSKFYAKGGP